MQSNLVFHIAIPRGLKLKNGATLMKDVTFDLISQLTPFYSSVDLVRLGGGPAIAKLSDITLACQIFQSSLKADLISPNHHPWFGPQYKRFLGARMQWTTAVATRDLMLNIVSLLGPSAHVLANFSADRKTDLKQPLSQIAGDIKSYEVAVRSGGRTVPGGRPTFHFAAKGVMDWGERTPGRSWSGNGMGANATSIDPGSATGGRGKPVKFFASPICSPPFSAMRSGIYQPGYPLAPTSMSSSGYY